MQEAGSWVREVFLLQFLLGFLPMVLFWWRQMRIRSIPDVWTASLESNVCTPHPSFHFLSIGYLFFMLQSLLIQAIGFYRFYFDFSMTYIGAGMICSYLVNLSLLFGAVLSWGLMWPLMRHKKGNWYPATLSQSSMKGLNGYKVCV